MDALAHLSDRAVLRLSGADARDFLQGQLTNDVKLLAEGRPLYAGHLSPQGKTLFALILFADGEDVLIDVAANQAEALAKRLTMFRLRKQVAIAPEPGLVVWQQWVPDEAPSVGSADTSPVNGGGMRKLPRSMGEGDHAKHGGGGPAADPRSPLLGLRFLAPANARTPTADPAEYHARRLRAGIPEAHELADLLWLETNAEELNGVSFTKGCYVGQENTARMHHRSKVNRRLLPLGLSADAPPDAPVTAETPHGLREAGTLRGRPHAGLVMAHLRLEHLGAPLSVGGAPAELVSPPWLPV